MFTDAGVIGRLLEICQFLGSGLLETELGYRGRIELALDLDEEHLAGLHDDISQATWSEGSAASALLTCCELGLAACAVLKSLLWEGHCPDSCREAEQALLDARSYYSEALRTAAEATAAERIFA